MNDPYWLLVVDDVAASAAFFRRWLGYESQVDSSWFVLLKRGDRPGSGQVAFMQAHHPTQRSEHHAPVQGTAALTFETEDVQAEYTRLVAAGAPIEMPLRDEPWGQRHFMLRDPAGIWIDIVQNIASEPQFWTNWG